MTSRMNRRQHPIRKFLIVQGTLVLETPTHLGNGDTEAPTDMALQQDAISGQVLLTGSSIAGALRSYLWAVEHGHRTPEPPASNATSTDRGLDEVLFGGRKSDDAGRQSPLTVADALSNPLTTQVELRDGVKIESTTGTASHQAKYDLELLAAGTHFPLRFDLAIPQYQPHSIEPEPFTEEQEQTLRQALATALHGLETGAIGLGMKKRRGFGRCRVTCWQVWEFDLSHPQQLLRWLAFEREYAGYMTEPPTTPALADALHTTILPDRRDIVTLTATFRVCDSILIRAGQDEAGSGPDVRHLHARQSHGTTTRPVLAGTSLAGVLRHRSERIANTLQPGSGKPLTEQVFGIGPASSRQEDKAQARASRIHVEEHVIEHPVELVQQRIAIDRFTGGAYDGALFSEQPVFAGPETRVNLTLHLHNPKNGEIGLLLLLLKDLWTGDLPVGGERSIGRGRLTGQTALLTWQQNGKTTTLASFSGGHQFHLVEGDRKDLEAYVTALKSYLTELQTRWCNGGTPDATSEADL